MLSYIRDWNTNSRTCHVAQTLLRVLLTTIPIERVVEIPGAEDILTGLLAYSQRHYARMERLQRSACVLDYMLGAMGVLDGHGVDDDDVQDVVDGQGVGTPEPREGVVRAAAASPVAAASPGAAVSPVDRGEEAKKKPRRKSKQRHKQTSMVYD